MHRNAHLSYKRYKIEKNMFQWPSKVHKYQCTHNTHCFLYFSNLSKKNLYKKKTENKQKHIKQSKAKKKKTRLTQNKSKTHKLCKSKNKKREREK